MKTHFLPSCLSLAALLLAGCDDKPTPSPTPTAELVDVPMELTIKGYAATPTGAGSFGVADNEADALRSKATVGTGSISWTESNGGKLPKTYIISQRKKGEKLWVFLTASRKAQPGQSVSLTWPSGHTLTVSSATDSVQVTNFMVGQ